LQGRAKKKPPVPCLTGNPNITPEASRKGGVRNTSKAPTYIKISIIVRKSRAIEACTRRATIRKAPGAVVATPGALERRHTEKFHHAIFTCK
jgi:hypothetical protein